MQKVKEDIALQVIERALAHHEDMRVVIGTHPIHGKPSSSVPYLDLSKALTCPEKTIYSIIMRSERVQKYCTTFMMKTVTGPKATLCVFEEGVLHIIMKLQPDRCQNPEVGARLDEIQDEMIQILRDALHGYQQKADHTSVSNAKTLAHLISVANKTTDHEYLEILNEQIELLSGKKIRRPRQLSLNMQN